LTSGSHYQAHSGLSPLSYHPCQAHTKSLISIRLFGILFKRLD